MSSWNPWNPWHGCRKISPGCQNCYVYRMDGKFGRNPSHFSLTAGYMLPLEVFKGGRNKGSYKLQPDDKTAYTCFTSDFLLEDADPHRDEAWRAIQLRRDLHFYISVARMNQQRLAASYQLNLTSGDAVICCAFILNSGGCDSRTLTIFHL